MHVLDATSLSRSPVAGWGKKPGLLRACAAASVLLLSRQARPGAEPDRPGRRPTSFVLAPAPARACIYRSPHRHHRSVGARPRLSKQDWPKTPRPHELIGSISVRSYACMHRTHGDGSWMVLQSLRALSCSRRARPRRGAGRPPPRRAPPPPPPPPPQV
jgi:hypothetical protein